MTSPGPEHESYLLRLWRAHDRRPWRSWLQCAASGEVLRFTSPDVLCAYLKGDAPLEGGAAPAAPDRRGANPAEEIR